MSTSHTVDSLRRDFIGFFAARDHREVPSASLIPQSPSTLLTGAGMQPFVPAFRGEVAPPATNVVTAQKCVRAGDIEEVGRTARHNTFFEMMGNFSFGGYFKREAIEWAWELVTEVWGVDPSDCWATVYLDDDESEELWRKVVGIPGKRVLRQGKEDNWWPQTVWDGPCGPCTELHVDRGPGVWCDDPDKGPLSKGDRFPEVWNLVFQVYNQSLDGSLVLLPQPGVDTGLGLERLATVMQGVPSIFDTDIFAPIMAAIAGEAAAHGSGARYGDSDEVTVAYKAIADHVRAVTFMIGDNILPSNEGRGYVLRRILRRAFRYARALGLAAPFLHRLVPSVVTTMGVGYPELGAMEGTIARIVRGEEERFCSTLDQGMARLADLIASVEGSGGTALPGAEVFRLYDTFGFHKEFTVEVAEEHGLRIDEEGYRKALDAQRSRSSFRFTESASEKAFFVEVARTYGASMFARDGGPSLATGVQAVIGEDELLEAAEEGASCALLLGPTPFYAEKGGQAADRGTIRTETGELLVGEVQEPVDGVILHIGAVATGRIEPGQQAEAEIDHARRAGIRRAHTATHLLHAALRRHLGSHVAQAGSLVEADRLRFDFSHYAAMTDDEIESVERTVQDGILAAIPVVTAEMGLEAARDSGATALFGEKYADVVRVVSVAGVSKELCGGTHLDNTGQVGAFSITSEMSVAAGARRIEALTGAAAFDHARAQSRALREAASLTGGPVGELVQRVASLQDNLRGLRKQVQDLKRRGAAVSVDELLAGATVVGAVKLVVAKLDGADADEMAGIVDRLVERDPAVVALAASAAEDGKVPIVCKVGAAAQSTGAHAGKLVAEVGKLCGGGGGGAPGFARAGGRDASALGGALAAAPAILTALLG